MYKYLVITVLFFTITTQAQVVDTLRYYTPYIPDSSNTCAFIGNCLDPGWCEPIAVWFTPDSSLPDTSYHYYSIKEIRFSFANIDTAFSLHLGKQLPLDSNRIYRKTLTLSFANDINLNFLNDGNYLFKSYDVSMVDATQNISIQDNFWVLLETKVSDIHNTTGFGAPSRNLGHSFNAGSPANTWINSGCDWIIEAVIEYQHDVVDGIVDEKQPIIPGSAYLFQNYLNPFNAGKTHIKYKLRTPGFVEISIYTTNGKKVKSIVNQHKNGGAYDIMLDVSKFASGNYFYTLRVNNLLMDSKKMMLVNWAR